MSDQSKTEGKGQILRILSYNMQVGIRTLRARHYVTGSWRHILPCSRRMENLDRIAHAIAEYDIVGLQEVDAGSLRSNFINQAEYLAERAAFPYWYHQVNRNLGRLAQHSNALLSHYRPNRVLDLRLPGLIPGRQAMLAEFNGKQDTLAVIVLHLALSKRARLQQLDYIAEIVNHYPHAVVMGDMNCRSQSSEMQSLFRKTKLQEPLQEVHTFPTWRPRFNIDHILCTSELKVISAFALEAGVSDHRPIVTQIELPPSLHLERYRKTQHLTFDSYMQNVQI
jgi:endonuclease/exonuclease/phosphatase family metal-dependent hydrolase